ncbi:MAG TPA: hypothetical protein VJK03_02260 [Candidatus Nanoarchaeia archaeon]|nr:hypothetical protein [Candidatus Nanoarchaeia archaeon]
MSDSSELLFIIGESKTRCATTPFRVWFVTGTRVFDAQGTSTLKRGVIVKFLDIL